MPRAPGPQRLKVQARGRALQHLRVSPDAVVAAASSCPGLCGGDVVLMRREEGRWTRTVLLSGEDEEIHTLDLAWTPDRAACVVAWARYDELFVAWWDLGRARARWRSRVPVPELPMGQSPVPGATCALRVSSDGRTVELRLVAGDVWRSSGYGPWVWTRPAQGGRWTPVASPAPPLPGHRMDEGPQGTLTVEDRTLRWRGADGQPVRTDLLPNPPRAACFDGGSVAAAWARGNLIERWDPTRGVIGRWEPSTIQCVGLADGLLATGSLHEVLLWTQAAWEARPPLTPSQRMRAMVQSGASLADIEAAFAPSDPAAREALYTEVLEITREEVIGLRYIWEARAIAAARGQLLADQGRIVESFADLAFAITMVPHDATTDACRAAFARAQTRPPAATARGDDERDGMAEHIIGLLMTIGVGWPTPFRALVASYQTQEAFLSGGFYLLHGVVMCLEHLSLRFLLDIPPVAAATTEGMAEIHQISSSHLLHAAKLYPNSALPWLWLGFLHATSPDPSGRTDAKAQTYFRAAAARWPQPGALEPALVTRWLDRCAERRDDPFHVTLTRWREVAERWMRLTEPAPN